MKRAVLRIQLDLDAKERLDEFCHSRGMTQIAVTSRLTKWFTEQDEVIQLTILGVLSGPRAADLSRVMLERIAEQGQTAGA